MVPGGGLSARDAQLDGVHGDASDLVLRLKTSQYTAGAVFREY
jgi:hypothetical protein